MRVRVGLVFVVAATLTAALAPSASGIQSAMQSAGTITQRYHCTTPVGNISASVNISGTVNRSHSNLDLAKVTFAFLNNFGVDITINRIRFTVPDPDPTNAPYKQDSAAVSKTPPGWTAGHTTSSGIFEFFKGTQDVPDGTTIPVPRLSASYAKAGPKGTLIEWKPGSFSFNVKSPDPGKITCTPKAPVRTFASYTE